MPGYTLLRTVGARPAWVLDFWICIDKVCICYILVYSYLSNFPGIPFVLLVCYRRPDPPSAVQRLFPSLLRILLDVEATPSNTGELPGAPRPRGLVAPGSARRRRMEMGRPIEVMEEDNIRADGAILAENRAVNATRLWRTLGKRGRPDWLLEVWTKHAEASATACYEPSSPAAPLPETASRLLSECKAQLGAGLDGCVRACEKSRRQWSGCWSVGSKPR